MLHGFDIMKIVLSILIFTYWNTSNSQLF